MAASLTKPADDIRFGRAAGAFWRPRRAIGRVVDSGYGSGLVIRQSARLKVAANLDSLVQRVRKRKTQFFADRAFNVADIHFRRSLFHLQSGPRRRSAVRGNRHGAQDGRILEKRLPRLPSAGVELLLGCGVVVSFQRILQMLTKLRERAGVVLHQVSVG